MAVEPKSSGRVSVGCKLPSGLTIQLERLEETVTADGVRLKRYIPVGEPVTLKGSNSSAVIGGYGITDDVDGAMFAAWLESHADYEPVRQGLIFAQSTPARAADEAKEKTKITSGFEPIDPEKPGPKIEPAPKT